MYYSQTRYYDPEVGRFLNMDSVTYADPEATNGLNLYVYCGNNPVMNVDPTGHLGLSVILISMLVGAVIGGTISGAKAAQDGLDTGGVILAALGGAIIGAATSGAFALGGAAATGLTVLGHAISGTTMFAVATYGTALASVVNYQLSSIAYGVETNTEGYFSSGLQGFFEGTVSFVFGGLAGLKGYFNNSNKSIFNMHKSYENISRAILFSLPSTLLRNGIKSFFNLNWGI